MVDLSKYKDVIMKIETYNEAMKSESESYHSELDRHPADYVKLSRESNLNENMIELSRLSSLRELFPNVDFSIKDIELLSSYFDKKQNNSHIAIKIESDIRSQEWYGGRTVSKEERMKMHKAKEKQPELDKQYTNAYTSFFEICEKLNNPEFMENQEYDYEGEIFSKIYENGFSVRPKNTILKKYYETYRVHKDREKEN